MILAEEQMCKEESGKAIVNAYYVEKPASCEQNLKGSQICSLQAHAEADDFSARLLLESLKLDSCPPIAAEHHDFFLKRSHFIDNVCKDAVGKGLKQFVFLSCGLETRGYRLNLEGLKVFDVDRDEILQIKNDVLKDHKPTGCVAIPFNFAEFSAMKQRGFYPAKKELHVDMDQQISASKGLGSFRNDRRSLTLAAKPVAANVPQEEEKKRTTKRVSEIIQLKKRLSAVQSEVLFPDAGNAVVRHRSKAKSLVDYSWGHYLCRQGFDPKLPTMWVIEGASMYCNKMVMSDMFEEIGQLSAQKSMVVYDLAANASNTCTKELQCREFRIKKVVDIEDLIKEDKTDNSIGSDLETECSFSELDSGAHICVAEKQYGWMTVSNNSLTCVADLAESSTNDTNGNSSASEGCAN